MKKKINGVKVLCLILSHYKKVNNTKLGVNRLARLTIQEAQKDKQLLDQFITDNMGLVKKIISDRFNYINGTRYYDDYFQIGCIGLVKAAQRFNPDFGTAFSTYAFPMIYGEIQRYRRDFDTSRVHLPRSALNIYSNYITLKNQEMEIDDIYEKLNVKPEYLNNIIWATEGIISLNAPVSNESNTTFEDYLADECDLEEQIIDKIAIEEFTETLSERDSKIFKLRLLGKSQLAIAEKTGITQSQVSRRLVEIIEKCKKIDQIDARREKYMSTSLFSKNDEDKVKRKITRDILLEECKDLSRIDSATTRRIGKKYGLNERTIKTYISRWKIKKELGIEESKERLPTKLTIPQSRECLEDKESIEEPKTTLRLLKPKVLMGKEIIYTFTDDGLLISDTLSTNRINITWDNIDTLLEEIYEVKILKKAQ